MPSKHTTVHKTVSSDMSPNPKTFVTKLRLLIVIVLVGMAGVSALLLSSAATPVVNLYVSPPTATVQQGANMAVALRVNPNGANTDGVSVKLTYDETKLQFVSIDSSQSPYTQVLKQKTDVPGVITIIQASGVTNGVPDPAITTDSLIATLNFKVLAGSGTDTLGLSEEQATYGGAYLNPTSTDATVTFSSPPPPTVSFNSLTSSTVVSTDLSIVAGQPNAQLNSASYMVATTPIDKSGAGIASVSLQLDNQPKVTLATGFSFSLDMTNLSCGAHTLVATVTDKAAVPKTGTTSVSFKAARGVDINANCAVDLSDYNGVRNSFGSTAAELLTKQLSPRTDINRNGTVDLSDYSAVRTKFGS